MCYKTNHCSLDSRRGNMNIYTKLILLLVLIFLVHQSLALECVDKTICSRVGCFPAKTCPPGATLVEYDPENCICCNSCLDMNGIYLIETKQSKLHSAFGVNMVVHNKVEGYDAFLQFMKDFKTNDQPVIILFSGSDLENGESWCDDCVRAHPVVKEALEKYATSESHFIEVKVGDRPFWKDMNCPFRKNADTRLMVLPTVLKWKTHQRLEGDQCEKLELLELLFTEE